MDLAHLYVLVSTPFNLKSPTFNPDRDGLIDNSTANVLVEISAWTLQGR